MKLTQLSIKEYQQSTWSGGETKEIYLSPTEGKYEIGQFDWRISTASIEIKKTTFTSLVGYQRQIMSLDNPLTLTHKYAQQTEIVHLLPLTPHFFLGMQQTSSVGVCSDFNLIYREGLVGELCVCFPEEEVTVVINQTCVIYCLEEMAVDFYLQEKLVDTQHLEPGSSLVCEDIMVNYDLTFSAKNETTKAIALLASIITD